MNALGAPVLELNNLHVDLRVGRERRVVVESVDLTVDQGESVGLVGESGSGKSMTARSVVRLLPDDSSVTGEVLVDGRPVFELEAPELRRLRGRDVAFVHQDPRAAMNPLRTIGDFMTEGVRHLPKADRLDLAATALREVGIDDAERRFRQYPHQLSGGLLQRVMIAAALLPGPRLVLADEPTTALDVTSQSEVMAVLSDMQVERGVGMVVITHDLDLAAAVTDRIAVMYAGVVVETGPTASIHQTSLHPYTVALMAARPSTSSVQRLTTIPGRPIAAYEVGAGCVFTARCPFATDLCATERPQPRAVAQHIVACHRAEELSGTIADSLEAGS